MATVGNWVGENTTTTGVGAITLGGALAGYIAFTDIGDTEIYYAIIDGNNREAGIGTLSGSVLSRTTISYKLENGVYSSSPGTGISLSGTANVYSTMNKSAFDKFNDFADSGETVDIGAVDDSLLRWDSANSRFEPVSGVRATEAGNLEVDGNADIVGAGNVGSLDVNSGNATINSGGNASFNTATSSNSPSSDSHLVRKDYVDGGFAKIYAEGVFSVNSSDVISAEYERGFGAPTTTDPLTVPYYTIQLDNTVTTENLIVQATVDYTAFGPSSPFAIPYVIQVRVMPSGTEVQFKVFDGFGAGDVVTGSAYRVHLMLTETTGV